LLTTTKENKYFEILKNLSKKNIGKLSSLDKVNMFTMMINFCHDMINSGKLGYRAERFLLDKEYLSNKLFESYGLHISLFIAIAKNALRLKEFKWAEDFHKSFANKIESSAREFALNYIKAEMFFAKKQYGKALESLSKLKIEQSNQKQYTRNLMLQIYYETRNWEAARSIIDTSRHFLHNDKYLSEVGKENSLNFVKFTEMLLRASEKPDGNFIYNIKREINSSINAQNKDWLLEKIEELSKVK
jgi:outer membrane PBP1 activator LpoA protein